MPKRRGRPHHHGAQERRLRQRGLQLPDPIMPAAYFHLPNIPRRVPQGWRFRPTSLFAREFGTIVLVTAGFTIIITVACIAVGLLLSAIAR